MKTLVLLVMMTVNGSPQGEPQRLIAMTESCRAELAMLEGINAANQNTGIRWTASCVADDQSAR